MTLKTIRLELARTPEYPEGSSAHGYEFTAPRDRGGQLDLASWKDVREACSVRRFWAGENDEHGVLLCTKRGRWVFSYAPGEDDDEPIFHFASHGFREGEYVSITEHDGVMRPFRVVSVRNAPLAGSRRTA